MNGTKCLLYRVDSSNLEIVGQMELTHASTSGLIEITSKSTNDFVTYMNRELSTKGANISANIVYNSDAEYRRLREKSDNGDSDSYMLDFTGQVADRVNFIGIPTQVSDSAPMGDKVSTSVTILSLGAVT